MRVDLSQTQWETISNGQVFDPVGILWSRHSTKAKRTTCEQLIRAGSPLVLYYYAGGQLEWLDGDDANDQWSQLRAHVTSAPRLRGDLEWTAGLWVDVHEHRLVLLTGHC
jgi:hypothetical protein